VLVHNAADINALNPTGTAPVGLGVVDKLTSTRSQVTIASNYNPDSLFYLKPPVATAQVAPDIVLTSGSKISNAGGAVSIASAAGNIYIQGEIEAGSLSIVAKNGDFVSSYVNGFLHAGGDPASFNSSTNVTEAGRGIIINGSISIAARYLNINSTIQSGIAEWTLDIGNNPMLTTTNAAHIGKTQEDVNAAVQAYLSSITSNGGAATSPIIDLGGGVILNMGPEGLLASEAAALQEAITSYLANTGGSPVRLVTIGGTAQYINIRDYISGGVEGRLEFSLSTLQAYLGSTTPANRYKLVTDGTPGAIGATYDAAVRQYVVDGTRVNGGYIQLYGQIINTAYVGSTDGVANAPAGKLNVLDGFGTINITNSSNIPVILQALHTGEDTSGTGRGVQGKIEITDVVGVSVSNLGVPVVDIRRTTYTRDYVAGDAAGQVRVLTEIGQLDNEGTFVLADGGSSTSFGGDRTATYNPTEYLRYVWQIGTDYQTQSQYKYTRNSFFAVSALTVSSYIGSMNLVSGPSVQKQVRLPDGTYLSTGTTQINNTTDPKTRNGLIVTQAVHTTTNDMIADQPLVSSDYSYETNINIQDVGTSKSCIGWTLCAVWEVTTTYRVTQDYTTVTTHSLKADNPIGINFIGSNAGAIGVSSGGDVVLAGAITNVGGTVGIDAGGDIATVGTGAVITARDIALEAGGSIGGVNYTLPSGLPGITGAPAVAVMLRGGALDAAAGNGSISIGTRSNLVVGTVTAGGAVSDGNGRVSLSALGSIQGADADALVQGQRVVLQAGGSIGSVADGQQLNVNTGFSLDRSFGDPAITPSLDTEPQYGLSAMAGGDIGISATAWSGNADGTMLVDQVLSLGGHVRLAAEGRILDNNPVETIDSRTYAQLLDYWNSLALMDGDANAAKQEATVAGFERSQTQAYEQYWRIRNGQADGGEAYDAAYALSLDPASALYGALVQQFGSTIRADNPGFDDAQVAQGVADRIADYEASQTQLYHDLHAKVGGLTGTFDANYAYEASDAERAALTDGASWSERQLAFSLSAGALKTVTSTNPVIKEPNVSGRTVTVEAGLGIGETVGAGTASEGVRIAATIDPADLTLAQRVALASAERSDLQLSVTFEGNLVDIPLGKERSDMSETQQRAFDAVLDGSISASDMTIVVLAKRPLNFNAPDGINVVVDTPPAGAPALIDRGTAHLASRGNALLGTITTPGETRIKVIGSIINASSGSAVNTGNLILEAGQGGIGAGPNPLGGTYQPLQLSLNDGATLTARAQNGVNIDFSGDALIDTVYSPQDVTLTSDGSILNANGDLLINILGKQVVLDAAGTIGSTAHSLNVGNNLGGGITATAGGLINLFGSDGHQFVISAATSQSGSISLAASREGVIDGAVTAPGQISLSSGLRMVVSSLGRIETTAGMIDVRGGSLKMINGATMVADIGRVVIDVDNDAVVTGITSGAEVADAVSITAGGRIFAGTLEDRVDIMAMGTGAGVYLRAGLGIGDRTQANDRWQDAATDVAGSANLVTDVPNALRISTNLLDIEAGGSVYLETLSEIFDATIVADPGDIYVWGSDSFYGSLISAVNGHVMFDINGDLTIEQLKARTFELSAAGMLTLPDIEVAEEAILRAGSLDAKITQVPEGPPRLKLTLTGYKGAVGNNAMVEVDAPAGLEIGDLFFTETDLATTARFVSIANAFVPGSLLLKTPLQTLLWENRTPLPQYRQNVQLYQPGFAFTLTLDNFRTITNAFVVKYDETAQIIDVLDNLPYPGASLVRDTIRSMYRLENASAYDGFSSNGQVLDEEEEDDEDEQGQQVRVDGPGGPYVVVGAGPWVNLGNTP
jgi:hypothetical protein